MFCVCHTVVWLIGFTLYCIFVLGNNSTTLSNKPASTKRMSHTRMSPCTTILQGHKFEEEDASRAGPSDGTASASAPTASQVCVSHMSENHILMMLPRI